MPKGQKRDWSSCVGQKFNAWTVISYEGMDTHREPYFIVQCECGRPPQRNRAGHVVRGISKGCRYCRAQASSGPASPYWKGGKYLNSTRYTLIKLSAGHRGVGFNVSIEYLETLMEKQEWLCVYTGLPLTFPVRAREMDEATASLDRIDSTLPYVEGNVQWVHKDANVMKMALPEARFLELCRMIAARHPGDAVGV